MNTKKKDVKLLRSQVDRKLAILHEHRQTMPPFMGQWIRVIREALGMTQVQLAKRLHVTPQTINALEKSEQMGTIAINTLKKIGQALGCSIYVTFIPHEPLEKMVRRQAQKVAGRLVRQIVHTMALEKQQPSRRFIEEQIEDLTLELVKTGNKRIWDET